MLQVKKAKYNAHSTELGWELGGEGFLDVGFQLMRCPTFYSSPVFQTGLEVISSLEPGYSSLGVSGRSGRGYE